MSGRGEFMKFLQLNSNLKYRGSLRIALFSFLCLQLSCAALDPREADVKLKKSLPKMKITNYTQALNDLGLMTEIYGAPALRIQSNPIGDNTGTSMATGGEIPRDITEMMKSSLNAIGGKVIFIPYDPAFMQNQMMTGYSSFGNKTVPDVILSGGITEFDRGLVTRGKNTDVSLGGEISNLPAGFPSNDLGLRYGHAQKTGLARITLDFNLLDFQTMTGIPKMNTVNSMTVHKALKDQELGISLFGQSFGGKGSIKKVQGRHAAVRLLVELSMIQIVGKHLKLPYWRLLGEDAKPDKFVMDQITQYYRCLSDGETIAVVQEWLYLYGFDVDITAELDEPTKNALELVQKLRASGKTQFHMNDPKKKRINFETFTYLYLHIPITPEVKRRTETAAWK